MPSTNKQTNAGGNSATAPVIEDGSTTSFPLGIEQIVDDDDGPVCYEEIADSTKSNLIFIGGEESCVGGNTATSRTRGMLSIEEIPDDELPISPFQYEEQLIAEDFHEKLKAMRSVQWQEPPVETEDRSTSSQQEEYDHDPVVVVDNDEESPPPPEEYPRTDRQDDTPPSPTFYAVEATLVKNDSEHDEPTQPVYDAEPLEELPFWKKHAKYIIISITLFFVVLTALIVGIMSMKTPDSTVSTPPYLLGSCVGYIGPLYETDCEGCSPPIGIDGNTTVCVYSICVLHLYTCCIAGMILNTSILFIGKCMGRC